MPYSNLRKINGSHKPPVSQRTREENDEDILALIKGINDLISQANIADMGMATRILCHAREELVHWAVEMNFHETAEDRFINSQLYCENVTQAMMLDSFVRAIEQASEMLGERTRGRRKPTGKA